MADSPAARLRSEHRFWAYRPLYEMATAPGRGGLSAPLCDLLGFGPTDGSAPGGGGAPRDGPAQAGLSRGRCERPFSRAPMDSIRGGYPMIPPRRTRVGGVDRA